MNIISSLIRTGLHLHTKAFLSSNIQTDIMATKNRPRTLRSKSCGGQPRQGLRSAVSDASLSLSTPKMHSKRDPSLWRDRPLPIPPQNQNKTTSATGLHGQNPPDTGNICQNIITIDTEKNETISRSEEKGTDTIGPSLSKENSSTLLNSTSGPTQEAGVDALRNQDTENRGGSTSNYEAGGPSGDRTPPFHEDKGTETPDFSLLLPPLPPGESWLMFFDEIRSIGKKLVSLEKIDKIDKTTDAVSSQLKAVIERTIEIEEAVKINAATIADVQEQTFSTKTAVEQHDRDIDKLKSLESVVEQQKKDIGKLKTLEPSVHSHDKDIKGLKTLEATLTKATGKVVDEMRGLVMEQRKQMDAFQTSSKQIKSNVAQLVEEKVLQVKKELDFKSLKKEAFSKRFNLVFTGLQEDPQKDTRAIVKDFVSNTLNLKDVNVGSALRIGSPQSENSNHNRPVAVSFANLAHRNKIWRNRNNISGNNDGDNVVRIHADLPKQLRKDVQVLYKVMKVASAIPEYQSIRIRDYMIELDGSKYAPSDLESLPKPIRPSTIAMRESEDTIVFYTCHSFLSNHHPSPFNCQGHAFANIEQFLAYKRAQLSGQEQLIQRALNATDPLEAKYILHLLKTDHTDEWNENINDTLAEGLRAKFMQNKSLLDKLRATHNKVLGEASTNPQWGIGIALEDGEVLNRDKWNKSGNLLGKTLMKIRSEVSRKDKNKHKNNK